jgi:hypothetical protein
MSEVTHQALGMAAVFLVVALGFTLAGAVIVHFAWRKAFAAIARFQQSGRPDAPDDLTPSTRTPASPEMSASRRISEQSIEKGADSILDQARASGVPMKRAAAIAQAKAMLEGDGPLGGVT